MKKFQLACIKGKISCHTILVYFTLHMKVTFKNDYAYVSGWMRACARAPYFEIEEEKGRLTGHSLHLTP